MEAVFTRMRGDVVAGNCLNSHVGLARGLDHWGIGRGALLESVAEIETLARSL
jgi:hypothetical protein